MSAQQKAAMSGFFSPQLLDGTRLLVLQGERVSNPEFYPMLKGLGFANLPDQSGMGAITFSDVVVSHEPFSNGLLFHELVHAEQYRQLGIPAFSELYVRGFLTGGSYDAIPMEVNAYTLGGRFESDPRRMFSVEDEVRRWAAQRGDSDGRCDRQVKISVIGRKSGPTISIPVWFALESGKLYLLPVQGSDTQWYRNVLKNPSIRIAARGVGAEFRATPVTDAKAVKFVIAAVVVQLTRVGMPANVDLPLAPA
jgi:hypothetical protein